MKTRTLVIIGMVIVAISATYVSFAFNQEIKLVTGMMTSDEKPQPQRILSEPIFSEIFISSIRLSGSLSDFTAR